MDPLEKFVGACLIIFVIVTIILFGFSPKYTLAYKLGVSDTHKEAFSKGLMAKEIDKDDKVIYKWIESK